MRPLVLRAVENGSHFPRLLGGVDRASQGKCHHVSDGQSASMHVSCSTDGPGQQLRKGTARSSRAEAKGKGGRGGMDDMGPETPQAGTTPTLPPLHGGSMRYTCVHLA